MDGGWVIDHRLNFVPLSSLHYEPRFLQDVETLVEAEEEELANTS